jgi:hypothetical protein
VQLKESLAEYFSKKLECCFYGVLNFKRALIAGVFRNYNMVLTFLSTVANGGTTLNLFILNEEALITLHVIHHP